MSAKIEAGKPAVHERLRRLLFLVPYVSSRPGIAVDELARALNIRKEDLIEDLELLAMVGRPPFQPDDYIDIYVDNDRVFVDLDQRLSAPPRLTAAEAAALTAAAELLRPASGDTLSTALAKLEKVLPAGARERFREMERKIDAAGPAPTELAPLSRAIVDHLEVEFDYFGQGRGAMERRTVCPRELFSHHGQWYLSAFCLSRNDDRLFRLDRIQALTVSDRRFTASAGTKSQLPNPARGEVRVRFAPSAGRYVQERFGDDAKPLPGGEVEVLVAGDSERWLTRWVLSFGGEARVVSPDWAKEAVARAARAALEAQA
ncbi:MAG: helix-turn-helix transcriptional regulator [Myxococcaceae bacterium]